MGRYILVGTGESSYRFANLGKIVDKQAEILTVAEDNLESFMRDHGEIPEINHLNLYGKTDSQTIQPMVVASKTEDGYCQCLDITGKFYNLSKREILLCHQVYGFANVKVEGADPESLVVRGLGWNIPVYKKEEAAEIYKMKFDTKPHKLTKDELDRYHMKSALFGLDSKAFEVDIDTSTLIKCTSRLYDRLIIPPVSVIGCNAFEDVTARVIEIPPSVTTIDCMAFYYTSCMQLVIQGTIEEDPDFATSFSGLHAVSIGDSFNNLYILRKLILHNDIESVEVSKNNIWFESEDGIAYTKGKKHIVGYPRERKCTCYSMPNSVEGILETYTFSGTTKLETLIISENIKHLKSHSIYANRKLRKIVLGEGVKLVDFDAIRHCPNLEEIVVNSSIEQTAGLDIKLARKSG